MDNFLVFLLGFVIAIVIIKYRSSIHAFTGDIAFAEKYFGSGGTSTFIVILAVLVFVGSLMYALGTLEGLVNATFGRFF